MECRKHISGLENPANVPSRVVMQLELPVNKLWQDDPKVQLEHEEQSDISVDVSGGFRKIFLRGPLRGPHKHCSQPSRGVWACGGMPPQENFEN